MSQHIEDHIVSRFQIIKKIGSGAYGHVWKVKDKKSNKIKALKKNFDAFNNSTDAQRTYRQIMFLTQLSHKTIIRLQEVIKADNDKDIYLIFQFMDVDLYTLIREDILAERHRKYIFYQMTHALYYLHSAGLIHRDIKPSNILVNQNCDAKLCDFGLVRSLQQTQEEQGELTEYIATRWYRAPQILLGSRKYSKAIDTWSMGCLLAQMYRGKPMFPGTSTLNQLERVVMWTGAPSQQDVNNLKIRSTTQVFKLLGKIKKVNHKQFIPLASEECMDLIQKLLRFDPNKRLSALQILTHPFLAQFYNKAQTLCSTEQIRVPVDDNQRLSLKQYRSKIYQQIRRRNKSSIDMASSTLYRIKHSVRKNVPKKTQPSDNKLIQKQDTKKQNYFLQKQRKKQQQHRYSQQPYKKHSLKKQTVHLGKQKHLKTIEKQIQPNQTKRKEREALQKLVNTKFQGQWIRKKRSTTQGSQPKKLIRFAPSPIGQSKKKKY